MTLVRLLTFIVAAVLVAAFTPAPASALVDSITTELVVSGLSSPVFVTHAPADSSRLFLLEQSGSIRIIQGDSLVTQPFMNIASKVVFSGERGLLGLAFHPDYESNGYFYVNYTAKPDGRTVIARYTVSADPYLADTASEFVVLEQHQPRANHNAGMIAFGPNDGYLYVSLGDGGGTGDPDLLAQRPDTLLGKMLRLDVDGGSPYAVPAGNPFVGTVDTLPEIWHIGYRNPYRWSFDRATGDMYVADVGQGVWEEVDVQPAASVGGENYGWSLLEGDSCYKPAFNCDPAGMTVHPVTVYSHGFGCAITGGYVYRGCAHTDLIGTYLYGDYCSGIMFAFEYQGDSAANVRQLPHDMGTINIASFGEDAQGEMYVVDYNGKLFRILPDGPSGCGPCCEGRTGNVDLAGVSPNEIDSSDLGALIDFLFSTPGTVTLACEDEADVDAQGGMFPVDSSDLGTLVNFLFSTPGTVTLPNCL